MCVSCGDFVDYCGQGACHNPDGGMYGTLAKFYVGDTFCVHRAAAWGHPVATWDDADAERPGDVPVAGG